MPYDPTLPVEGTECDAAQMRSQFTGLKALIDALAAAGVTGATVDTTNTGSPGSSAAVSVSLAGGVLHFAFDVPQGQEGQQGPQGEVSQWQLNNDLANCQNAAVSSAMSVSSANSNGVNTLSLPVSNPPTQTEVQALANKLDELINALRR